MRILIVSNTYPPADISGVGALVYELAHQLGAKGHGVVVLTRKAPAGEEGGASLMLAEGVWYQDES